MDQDIVEYEGKDQRDDRSALLISGCRSRRDLGNFKFGKRKETESPAEALSARDTTRRVIRGPWSSIKHEEDNAASCHWRVGQPSDGEDPRRRLALDVELKELEELSVKITD
ncbi:hypothetical protein EYF80_037894 [Liparis tanakae]|uniref:Uncharacterized protein n=1 Tax=Liparis tanakae TaxID=230148 RepID=A0A4Z2GG99_9TELE|nr:hypothetical protein EYF80_037894 [Liparis tanakae]